MGLSTSKNNDELVPEAITTREDRKAELDKAVQNTLQKINELLQDENQKKEYDEITALVYALRDNRKEEVRLSHKFMEMSKNSEIGRLHVKLTEDLEKLSKIK